MRRLGAALAWSLILFTLAVAVCGIAGNGSLLAKEMLRCAPPETTGLPAAEYGPVGQMTADYLKGHTEVFQHTFSDEAGTQYQCFHPHEAAHMKDCRGLIHLAEILRAVFGAGAAGLLAVCALRPADRRKSAQGVLWGLRSAAALLTVLLVWGLADFDGLFTAFHRVVFTNEGWLLNPRTDLLIRLMPTEFFIRLAVRILIWIGAAAATADLGARVMER